MAKKSTTINTEHYWTLAKHSDIVSLHFLLPYDQILFFLQCPHQEILKPCLASCILNCGFCCWVFFRMGSAKYEKRRKSREIKHRRCTVNILVIIAGTRGSEEQLFGD